MKFTSGMQPDPNLYGFVDGSWLKAKNIRRVNGVIEVDYGTVSVSSLGGEVVGVCNTGTLLYIFTSEQTAGNDRIYKFDGSTVTIIIKGNLELSPSIEISVVFKYNEKGDVVLAWSNSTLQLRVLNVSDLPIRRGLDSYNVPNFQVDLKTTYVTPKFDYSNVKLEAISGGLFTAGIYQVAIRYKYKDVVTNWTLLSNRVVIEPVNDTLDVPVNTHTAYTTYDNEKSVLKYASDMNSNGALQVTIEPLDLSYDKIDIAIFKTLETGEFEGTASIKYNINITNYSSQVVILFGSDANYLDIAEILNDYAPLYNVRSLTNFRDNLLIGGYTHNKYDLDNVALATSIDILWEVKEGDENDITFQWGEVYAFYAAYQYEDGSIGPFMHIQGRDLVSADRLDYTLAVDNKLQSSPKSFHIEDTSTIDTYVSRVITGSFGAWENSNETDSITDQPMRHFRFPHKFTVMDYLNSTGDTWTTDQLLTLKLGIKVNISSTTLPTGVKSIVIAHAKRDLNNATVLDVGGAHTIEVVYDAVLSHRTLFEFPICIRNNYTALHPYFVGVHGNDYTSNNTIDCHVDDYKFRIEDNGEDDNEGYSDNFAIDLYKPWFAHSSVQLMNDVRDIYNSVYNQELIIIGEIQTDTLTSLYNGDVFTSKYVSRLYSDPSENTSVIYCDSFLCYITSPYVQSRMELVGLPFFDNFDDATTYEKGVQTLSNSRFYMLLRGFTTLNLNKVTFNIPDIENVITNHPVSILTSTPKSTVINNWLLFNPVNYNDIPNINGSIYQLITYGNALYIRTDRSLYVAKIRDTFDMSNGQVGLKSGDLFDQIPQELLPTSNGFIKGNSKLGTYITKIGVVMVDTSTASIYVLGQEMVDLTIINKEYFKQLFSTVADTHLSLLTGVSVCFESEYNRLFVTIKNTVLTFDIMTKQLISTFELEPNYMFSLLGDNQPYYICGNSEDGFAIKQLSNTTFPDEAYIEVAIAADELPSFAIDSLKWITVGGVTNTIEAISIWTDISATGVIDVSRADVATVNNNHVIQGNTTFDVDGVFRFNDIFDNVIDTAVSIFSTSDVYNVELNSSNIDTSKRDTDLFGTHMRIRLYLRKSGSTKANRNCKLKSIDLRIKPYTSKFD